MALVVSDYIESFKVEGASVPIASKVASSTRTLTDLGTTSTPPRNASYSGTRGAEFRTSSFSASSPQCLGCAVSTGLNTALYVSNKIQNFTYLAKFRPSKTGLTALSLTPIGGLFSATNMGATPWALNQPCLVFLRQLAGSSRIIVSVMGAILDTTVATQTSGPTSTEPSSDAAWQVVAVSVTGNASTSNQVDSVVLTHITSTGTRREWTLGAHRAAALLAFTTNPSNGNVVTINGQAYTFSTALAGVAATGTINGSGTNVADGDTVTVGSVVYTFKTSVTAAVKATATVVFNAAKATYTPSDKAVPVVIGGFRLMLVTGSNNNGVNGGTYPAGAMWVYNGNDADGAAGTLHRSVHGDADGTNTLKTPASPLSGNNAGKDFSSSSANTRNFTTKFAEHGSDTIRTVTLEARSAGTAGNATTLAYADGNATPLVSSITGTAASPAAHSTTTAYVEGDAVLSGGNVYICVKANTNQVPPNTTYWAAGFYKTFTGGVDSPTASSVLIGANWAATKANLIAAINAAAGAGTTYSADITTANALCVASDPGGNNILLTSNLTGTAGNGQTLSESSAQLTVSAFAGGSNGADGFKVLIGATAAISFNHLIDAINLTGSRGLDYGSPTTLNSDVTASLQSAGVILLVAKGVGTAGNSVTLTTDVTGVTFTDEWGDKTQTVLSGGSAAPPFVASAGARPDNADMRLFHGGWST